MDGLKLRISKIEAAQRQLDCAIELWFLEKDEVSVHTLAAAAYQIVHDLKAKNKELQDLLYDTDLIKDEYRKRWVNIVKEPANFFKHADNDGDLDRTIELPVFSSLMFLMFATVGLRMLGQQTSPNAEALTFWITLHEPQLVTAQWRATFLAKVKDQDLENFRKIPKAEFLSIFISAWRAATAHLSL